MSKPFSVEACDFSGWATRNDLKCSDGRVMVKSIPSSRKPLLSFRKRLTDYGWSVRNRVY